MVRYFETLCKMIVFHHTKHIWLHISSLASNCFTKCIFQRSHFLIFKLLVILIIFGSGINTLSAQSRDRNLNLQQFDVQLLHWGFFLGLSRFDFKSSPTPAGVTDEGKDIVSVMPSAGFSIGLIGDLRLHKNIGIRLEPSVHFTNKTLFFSNQPNSVDSVRNTNSNYIDIPLLVKFNSNRTNNIRPYIAGGVGVIFNLSSKQDSEGDNLDGAFRQKRTNFNWQMEFGIEIYLKYFKLTPAIKGVFMLNNEVIPDDPLTNENINGGWTRNINYLKTRAIVFSLKFQ